MQQLVTVVLVLVGIIHLLPLAGVLGVSQLKKIYGVDIDGPDLAILMRHRAVLFGLLGGFFIVAGFVPVLQLSAFIMGFISVASFLILTWTTHGSNAQLARVSQIDLIALLLLVVGFAMYLIFAGFAFMVLPMK
jgi:hypothetical protein